MDLTIALMETARVRVGKPKRLNGHSVQRITAKTVDGSTLTLNFYRAASKPAKRK